MNVPIPRPGEHRSVQTSQDSPESPEPETVAREIDVLLAELTTLESDASEHDGGVPESMSLELLATQARILERAHDVLVQALATVDKI